METTTTRRVFTVDDVERDGADHVLAELRRQFEDLHADYRQYDGWTFGTVLAVVTYRQGRKFTQAEVGDVVLMKPDPYPLPGFRDDLFYVPRVGWNCRWSGGYRRLGRG